MFRNGESIGAPAPCARTTVGPSAGPSKIIPLVSILPSSFLYTPPSFSYPTMIPTSEQLEEIARLREGSITQVPFAPLLLAHALRQESLVLELRRRQVWKRILIENGVPVDCRSHLTHEPLGRFMVAEGKLGEEDFTACLSRSASRGVPFGEILQEHGLVTPTDLFRILQQNLAKKLLDLFTWNEGELRWLD